MTQAQQLATELNAYSGDNYWQDVVLSEKYSIDSDRSDQGNGAIVFLEDDSKVMYDEREKTWTAYEGRVVTNNLVGTKGYLQNVGNGHGSLNSVALREDGWNPALLVEVCEVESGDRFRVSWGEGSNQKRWIKQSEFRPAS